MAPSRGARPEARGPGEQPVGAEALPGTDLSAESDPETDGGPVHPGTDAPSLVGVLEMALSQGAWDSFSRGSPIRRAGRAGFARNVCVGLGNGGRRRRFRCYAWSWVTPKRSCAPVRHGHWVRSRPPKRSRSPSRRSPALRR